MTPEQVIQGMLERQQQILKLRSKPKQSRPSDKVIDRVVNPKGRVSRSRAARAHKRYQRRQLGKLGAASKVRHLNKDGKPMEQTP
jgi:hypothetical protein